ncbi:MAG: hypothetical protein KKD29_05295, partial [Candidatus Omnitrophica bacterium]|nr:hypothetical protein [Candidatus Omnitrophota bacterium]
NTAAATANSAAEEAETVLAGTPELLSQANIIIGVLNGIESELDTLTDTQLASAIAAAEELLNNAQSIVQDEILQDIIAFEEQREKDAVKEEMARLLERQHLRTAIRNAIQDILEDGDLRRFDGYMEKISDAQTGKVMKDIYGDRVRVEQYILRPSSKAVELLNVNLRAGNDLTTMQWVTTFNKSLNSLDTGQLKRLHWNEYLNTKYDDGVPHHIVSSYQPQGFYPQSMSIKLSHAEDAFTERKEFSGARSWRRDERIQRIDHQTLLVNNFNKNDPMPYARKIDGLQPSGTYSITSGLRNADIIGGEDNNPKGFRYNMANAKGVTKFIGAEFYVISDKGKRKNKGGVDIRDLGDALRVNMGSRNLNIGNNNLEMIFTSSVFHDTGGIDLIYVPTNRMDWKRDDNVPNYLLGE